MHRREDILPVDIDDVPAAFLQLTVPSLLPTISKSLSQKMKTAWGYFYPWFLIRIDVVGYSFLFHTSYKSIIMGCLSFANVSIVLTDSEKGIQKAPDTQHVLNFYFSKSKIQF